MSFPGWLRRFVARRRLERELRRAEEQLGLYGWQSAHFDVSLQATVDFLREVERAQVDLLNGNADLAWQIERIREESSALIGDYARQRQMLALAEAAVADEPEPIREARARAASFERATEELDGRLTALEKERIALLATKGAGVDGKIRQLMAESLRIKAERDELDLQRRIWISKCFGYEKASAGKLAELEAAKREFRRARRSLLAKVTALEARRFKLFSERAHWGREFRRADRLKLQAYRTLGAALADAQVPPPNQPELLEMVLLLRKERAALDSPVPS